MGSIVEWILFAALWSLFLWELGRRAMQRLRRRSPQLRVCQRDPASAGTVLVQPAFNPKTSRQS